MTDNSGGSTADPRQYEYARAERGASGRPPERAVELHIRSETGVASGPIPQDALDAVDGFWLRLSRPADFSMLGRLGGLKWLVVQAPVAVDVGALAAALASTPVRSLRIEAPVADIAPLSALTSLSDLVLRNTLVTDLTPLAELSALGGVFVSGEPPADPAPPPRRPRLAPNRTEDVLAAFRATDDFAAKWAMLPRLIATRDRAAVEEAIRHQVDAPVTVRGLLLQDGRCDVPFAANPWNVRADAGLTAALDQVWRPLADLVPLFVATMHARTLGLALLADDDTGAMSLAYLTWGRDGDRGGGSVLPWHNVGRAVPLDDFAEARGDVYIQVIVGTAPSAADPAAEHPLLAGPVPGPVRDFWAVHHSLDNTTGGSIGGKLNGNTLDFVDGDWDTGVERTGGPPPDRFVHSVGNGDFEMYVLDLDVLDSAGSPTVACWHWKSWNTGEHMQFWDWLDTTAVKLVWF
ncbi:hypothetical protein OG216_37595 [Streptomycetaceae bacterium NBC_01309]